jgi:hypothetical protein
MLGLIQPWGLALEWHHLSYVSLTFAAAWYAIGLRATRGHLAAFRRSIERGTVTVEDLRLTGADLSFVGRRESTQKQLRSTRIFHECLTRRKLVTRHGRIDLQTLRRGHERALGPGIDIWRALHQRIRRCVLDDCLHARPDSRNAEHGIWYTNSHAMEPDEVLRSAARVAPRSTGTRRGRVEVDLEISIDA